MVVSTMGKVAKLSNEMHNMGVSFLHFSPLIKAPPNNKSKILELGK